jgi:hypothetical protein
LLTLENAVLSCTAALPFCIITALLLQPQLKVVNSNHKFRLKKWCTDQIFMPQTWEKLKTK